MHLYYAPGTIAVAIAITLHEAGLPFDLAPVDFRNGEQTKASYHTINPKGRVPVLETSGTILTETGAILEYIGALAPRAGLIPSDPVKAAKMHEVMYYLASTMHVNRAHKMRGARWADQSSSWQDMTAKVAENLTENAHHIETCSLTGPFVLGDKVSLADPYLYTVCTWLEGDGVDMSAFPRLTAFMTMMTARPSVQATIAQGMLP